MKRFSEVSAAYLIALLAILIALTYAWYSYVKAEENEQLFRQTIIKSNIMEELSFLKKIALNSTYWDTAVEKVAVQQDPVWTNDNIGSYLVDNNQLSNTLIIDAQLNPTMMFGKKADQRYQRLRTLKKFEHELAHSLNASPASPVASSFAIASEKQIILVALNAFTFEDDKERPREPEENTAFIIIKIITQSDLSEIGTAYNIQGLSFTSSGHEQERSLQITWEDERNQTTLYYICEHSFMRDFGFMFAMMCVVLLSFTVLVLHIQKKNKAQEQLNSELADSHKALKKANTELATFNDRLEEQVELQYEEIIKERDKAESASAAKTVFLSNMSHEFRTPLNGLLGFAQMLQLNKSKNLSEKQIKWVKHITTSGTVLLDLVNSVLNLARIESGRTEYEPVSLAPSDLFEQSRNLVAPMAEEKNISLTEVAQTTRNIYTDPKAMQQILLNLFGNAIKYSDENGKIRYGCHNIGNNKVELFIEDEGIGIATEHLDKIFDPFYRVDATSIIEGTGVGLSIVKKNVELMGGEIHATSTIGEGTRFIVTLPAHEVLNSVSNS